MEKKVLADFTFINMFMDKAVPGNVRKPRLSR